MSLFFTAQRSLVSTGYTLIVEPEPINRTVHAYEYPGDEVATVYVAIESTAVGFRVNGHMTFILPAGHGLYAVGADGDEIHLLVTP